jgi:hypothetical protein
MTHQPTQTQPLPLDPATLTTLLRTTVDTLPHHPNASEAEKAAERAAASAVITALRPRDPVEAMLVARLVAAHYAAMDALRCASRSDLPPVLHLRYQDKALALTRMTTTLLHELTRRQAGPALQPVALPASVPAPRAQQAPATAPSAPAQQATPASRPETAAARQRPLKLAWSQAHPTRPEG